MHGTLLRPAAELFPLYHPAAAMYNQTLRATLFADARALGALVRTALRSEVPRSRLPSAKRAGSGAPPSQAAAIRSAIAGPCLKPCPEPPPTIQTRRVLGVRGGDEVQSGEIS